MTNIGKFDVTCKTCGSKNVDLSGYSGQNYVFGCLTCMDCNEEEEKEY